MRNLLSLILAFVLTVFLWSSTYTVPQYQQAIVLQLGKVVGTPIKEPGLHAKLPFIQDVKYFESRILQWDGQGAEFTTKDKKFIWVDICARWRIKDALQFYRSVRDVPIALTRMGQILDGAARDTVGSFNLIEAVRNTNKILDEVKEHPSEGDNDFKELASELEPITHGREKLSRMISDQARQALSGLGIELIDVQLRSIAYQERVEKTVFKSMISEREQMATKIRSAGKGEMANILGQLDLKLKEVESEAYRQGQAIRGEAEATAIKIYADSFKEDPSFYSFVKTLETYKQTISKNGDFILSADSAFLRLLRDGP